MLLTSLTNSLTERPSVEAASAHLSFSSGATRRSNLTDLRAPCRAPARQLCQLILPFLELRVPVQILLDHVVDGSPARTHAAGVHELVEVSVPGACSAEALDEASWEVTRRSPLALSQEVTSARSLLAPNCCFGDVSDVTLNW